MSAQESLLAAYVSMHCEQPTVWGTAPGRVNLIGEHTDYNGGFVLPCAINFATYVVVGARTDALVDVTALDMDNGHDQFRLDEAIAFHGEEMWCNYVRGVVQVFKDMGHRLMGCNIILSGDIPLGAGLSSSASLEVALVAALADLNGISLTRKQMAQMGQKAENDFVGCACGIMDQMSSACGSEGQALLIDCLSLDVQPVPIPDGLSLVIINSNVKRSLVTSAYNERRRSCEEAAHFFSVPFLRDVSFETYNRQAQGMDPLVSRRAKHIISENNRTLEMARALTAGDVATMSRLMRESHASMRDDFEITVPEVDYIVAVIDEILGDKGGVRMTGGGFGGCIVALAPHALVPAITAALGESYERKTGIRETLYVCHASDGVAVGLM